MNATSAKMNLPVPSGVQQTNPTLDTHRISFLDLPNEIKIKIYDCAWEEFGGPDRVYNVRDMNPDLFWDSKEEGLEGRPYSASPALWAFALTCKEVNAMVLPLVYKGVQFIARGIRFLEPDYYGFAHFAGQCRTDLIDTFFLRCLLEAGMGPITIEVEGGGDANLDDKFKAAEEERLRRMSKSPKIRGQVMFDVEEWLEAGSGSDFEAVGRPQ
ncbi:hypothetical protein K461DRAFT_295691 [Myriangium duriaei CBS 260.36]|uniref:Uncharacterized protein n=1 Tax=Myriangium duriaei CBS 260.36 TaxID=1168546 RepID=A0A9P4J105_9PEZI|nr:hypothetical protein K461DRAFT_295691 [Myriangium duriaei CBS 260.36]